jgi:endonuclease YncB( thermonuclease family)
MMPPMLHRLVILLFLLLPAAVAAANLAPGGTAGVVEVVDGDTVILDDGRQVRLVGIQAPKLPLGREGFRAWPLAEEAKVALERLVLGRQVALSYGGSRIDRYDRALAHLHVDPADTATGIWVQGALLRDGMARVYSFRDNRALVPEMLALEQQARAHRRGIWGLDWYAVRGPDDLQRDIGSFQLVEGQVHATAVVRGRLYINFAEDWRSDFTISVAPRLLKLFKQADFPVDGLGGRRVRVRGWLKSFNGPLIEATHPEQIEILP